MIAEFEVTSWRNQPLIDSAFLAARSGERNGQPVMFISVESTSATAPNIVVERFALRTGTDPFSLELRARSSETEWSQVHWDGVEYVQSGVRGVERFARHYARDLINFVETSWLRESAEFARATTRADGLREICFDGADSTVPNVAARLWMSTGQARFVVVFDEQDDQIVSAEKLVGNEVAHRVTLRRTS